MGARILIGEGARGLRIDYSEPDGSVSRHRPHWFDERLIHAVRSDRAAGVRPGAARAEVATAETDQRCCAAHGTACRLTAFEASMCEVLEEARACDHGRTVGRDTRVQPRPQATRGRRPTGSRRYRHGRWKLGSTVSASSSTEAKDSDAAMADATRPDGRASPATTRSTRSGSGATRRGSASGRRFTDPELIPAVVGPASTTTTVRSVEHPRRPAGSWTLAVLRLGRRRIARPGFAASARPRLESSLDESRPGSMSGAAMPDRAEFGETGDDPRSSVVGTLEPRRPGREGRPGTA